MVGGSGTSARPLAPALQVPLEREGWVGTWKTTTEPPWNICGDPVATKVDEAEVPLRPLHCLDRKPLVGQRHGLQERQCPGHLDLPQHPERQGQLCPP